MNLNHKESLSLFRPPLWVPHHPPTPLFSSLSLLRDIWGLFPSSPFSFPFMHLFFSFFFSLFVFFCLQLGSQIYCASLLYTALAQSSSPAFSATARAHHASFQSACGARATASTTPFWSTCLVFDFPLSPTLELYSWYLCFSCGELHIWFQFLFRCPPSLLCRVPKMVPWDGGFNLITNSVPFSAMVLISMCSCSGYYQGCSSSGSPFQTCFIGSQISLRLCQESIRTSHSLAYSLLV